MSKAGVQRAVQNPCGRIFKGCFYTCIQKLRAGGKDDSIALLNGFADILAAFLRISVCNIGRGNDTSGKGIIQLVPAQLMPIGPTGSFRRAVVDKSNFNRRGWRKKPGHQCFLLGFLLRRHNQFYASFGGIDFKVLPYGRYFLPKLFIRFFQNIFISVYFQISQKCVARRDWKLTSSFFVKYIKKMDICGAEIYLFIFRPNFLRFFADQIQNFKVTAFLTEIKVVYL